MNIFDVGTARAKLHRKKIAGRMKKVNGKPYLRTQIALRVIVWWPFCDFFLEILIPALVKVAIGQHGALARYTDFFNRCHFSLGKSVLCEMRAETKKNSAPADLFGVVRFTAVRDTFLPTT